VEEKLKSVFVSVFGIGSKDIIDTTSPQNLSSWDSLKHMNLIVAIEEVFAIEFDEEEFANMSSFGAIKSILEAKLQ